MTTASPSPASVLRDVRALITPPERWTQGVLARHKNGNSIGPKEPNAICWCIVGACKKSNIGPSSLAFELLRDAAKKISPAAYPVYVNDILGHAAVLKMIDIAIATAEV